MPKLFAFIKWETNTIVVDTLIRPETSESKIETASTTSVSRASSLKQANQPEGPISLKPEEIRQIIEILPHRYPFLLVDRVTEHVQGERIKGYKNVTFNEPFFQGHFPGDPIMPGVLQLEALAQLGAILMLQTESAKGKMMVFAGMDKVRFRRMVVPGDKLEMECVLSKFRFPIGKSVCKAYVDGQIVVEGELMFSIVDRSK
jgi:3-hydroxyacyl-[acyl-carrier-protein] dehydratase